RDSALDNGIIIHELTHGLTHHMTGGGTTRSLRSLEGSGLGEGWSDAMADWVFQTSAPIKDYVHAVYATGNPNGNRMFPYSTSAKTNPLRYRDVKTYVKKNSIHSVSPFPQIWANLLHNVHAALVEKYGFSTSAMTNPNGSEGNIVFLHLSMD
ncbi:peptidase M36, partial [Mycena maculata]